MRKRILVSAAGTAAAFHLSEVIQEQFRQHFELFLCDTNPAYLVAAATFTKNFFQVPPAADPAFRTSMLRLFAQRKIELYVPLIDRDVYTFPSDDRKLRDLRVRSVAPPRASARILRNKRVLVNFLRSRGFSVPVSYSLNEVSADPNAQYFVKPIEGFGSRGVSVMSGRRILEQGKEHVDLDWLVQEVCQPPEVTIEVYNSKGTLRSLCRDRLEVKSGVCTKARLFRDAELTCLAESLTRKLQLPEAFCFQVMKNKVDDWVITDINPRLGAGTALSSACGWSLAAAALVSWGELPEDPLRYIQDFDGDRFGVRAFRELRTA